MITVYATLNVIIWLGYLAVAGSITYAIIKARTPRWQLVAGAAVVFFFFCGLTHFDNALHAFSREPLTVHNMGDAFHVSHTAAQAVSVWAMLAGVGALRMWIKRLLADIARLEALVAEVKT